MQRSLFLPGLIFALMALIGCGNADYIRNNDGLIYRIIKTGKGEFVQPKTYLKVHQSAGTNDTIFFSTFSKVPAYGYFDSMPGPSHDFLDILPIMRVGDSAILIRSVDTLVKRGVVQYNETFRKGATIKVFVKVLGAYATEDEMNEDRQKEFDAYKKREIADLEAHISKLNAANKIDKLPEGVFVITEKQGTGAQIDSGMNVSVNYTGSLLDGSVFDSNVDSTFGHTEPFKFTVGSKQVIEGWDLGIKKLNVGSKGKIFIPSMLGYGIQGSGPKLPPYSNLMFDIEVLAAGTDTSGTAETDPTHQGHKH